MARYEAGETLASIARTYDCSPPAISYVVSRSRGKPNVAAVQPQLLPDSRPDPRLIKHVEAEATAPNEAEPADEPANVLTQSAPIEAAPVEAPSTQTAPTQFAPTQPTPVAPPAPQAQNGVMGHGQGTGDHGNGHAAPNGTGATNGANGEHRRTLHLSLGQSSHSNGARPAIEAPQPAAAEPPPPSPVAAPATPQPYHRQAMAQPGYGRGPTGLGEADSRQERGRDIELPIRKDAYIDSDLRARVNDDIAVFLAAFDAALLQDSQESRSSLREATDRLLRAGARTRIELERLEARIPLPPRERAGNEPAWRLR